MYMWLIFSQNLRGPPKNVYVVGPQNRLKCVEIQVNLKVFYVYVVGPFYKFVSDFEKCICGGMYMWWSTSVSWKILRDAPRLAWELNGTIADPVAQWWNFEIFKISQK